MSQGFLHLAQWIDTCCIDKTSSAELSEAINSMFKWYGDAEICYAYLQDVEGGLSLEKQLISFMKSRWFTRGWTLQELIAPSVVLFFAEDWSEIGSRSIFVDTIAQTTGIDRELFNDTHLSVGSTLNQQKLSQYSVAQKMSWASSRETSRLEDEAYCLLGLFGVNMALLYGEGRMAFIRLQEEIMKRSSDPSIFAWNPGLNTGYLGFLADSPALFADSSDIVEVMHDHDLPPYGITNKGIQITLPILDSASYSHDSDEFQTTVGIRFMVSGPKTTYIAFLCCAHSNSQESVIAVSLEQDEAPEDEAAGHVPYFRMGQLLNIQVGVLQKAFRSTVLLQSMHNSMDSRNKLWRKSEEWPLVFVRKTPREATREFRLIRTWPQTVEWTTHEPGVLSARFGGGDISYLFFGRDHDSAFCLIIACDRRTTDVEVVEHVPMNKPDWTPFKWIDDKNKSGSFEQESNANVVSISALATRRLYGAVIELRFEV
jgi:hypothetical protein